MAECEVEHRRLKALNMVLSLAWEKNRFYPHKWIKAGLTPDPLDSVASLEAYPFTTRQELFLDQEFAPPLGKNISCSPGELKRFHRSSGTTEAPILWADTVFSWEWVLHNSADLWRISGIQPEDRILFASALNANSGPWIMFEGACRVGCACIFAGNYSPEEIARTARDFRPTIIAGKAAILHQVAQLEKCSSVHRVVITAAAEQGIRSAIEDSYGAESFDRYGMTEAGSIAAECPAHNGAMHLLDEAFVAEVIHPRTGELLSDGQCGELVLTTLGRFARPIVRYRTGDMVTLRKEMDCPCGRFGTLIVGPVHRLAKNERPLARSV